MKKITIVAIMTILCAWTVNSPAMSDYWDKKLKPMTKPGQLLRCITLHNKTEDLCYAGKDIQMPVHTEIPRDQTKILYLEDENLTLLFPLWGIIVKTLIEQTSAEEYYEFNIIDQNKIEKPFYPVLHDEATDAKLPTQTISIIDYSTTPPTIKPYIES